MPTASTSPSASASRGPAAKRTATRRTTSTARKRTSKAKAKGAKTARVRAASQTRTGFSATTPARNGRPTSVGDYAERAVLIPVGAALTARDRVISSVSDTLSTYSSPTKTQAQLRRFERRGATARKRLEREVRKTRVRFERELRQRRRRIERTVGELEDRRDEVAKNGTDLVNRVQERVLSLV